MIPQILTLIERPDSEPGTSVRPLIASDLDGPALGSTSATLVLPGWPDGSAPSPLLTTPFRLWSGPVLIVPDGDAGDLTPSFARVILAASDADRLSGLSEWIADLAVQARSRLMLLVVLKPDHERLNASLKRQYDQVQRQLAELVAGMRARGIQATWEVRFGELGEEIARLAETTGTSIAAVHRPATGEDGDDFEKLLEYVRERRPDFHILISPTGQ